MKQLTKILLAAGALVFTATSFADAAHGQGFYLGGDIGTGATTCNRCGIQGTLFNNNYTSTSNSGAAFNAFAGYQFIPYLALEAGYGKLPDVKFTLFGLSTTAAVTHAYVAVKGIVPLQGQFSLFGKAGYDYMTMTANDDVGNSNNANGLLLAAGGSYNVNTNVAVSLSYNQLLDTDRGNLTYNVGYGALGFTYLF